MKTTPLVLSLTGFLCLASANAQLAHRYNLNTDGTDSIGGANGQISGGAFFTGDGLATGGGSGDYLALPTSVGTGITGNFTIQTFVNIASNPGNFSSLFSLSSPGNRNFFLLNPSRPAAGGNLTADFQQRPLQTTGGTDTEVDVSGASAFPFGATDHDVTITYVASTNIATIYLDGAQFASGNIANAISPGTSLNLETLTSGGQNGINGGGPFGDASINGITDDFRVYSSALTAAQVSTIDALGADASNATISAALVPEPSTWVMMLLSLAALCGVRHFRRSQA